MFVSLMWKNELFQKEENMECPFLSNQFNFASLLVKSQIQVLSLSLVPCGFNKMNHM
jgi:hypothetical protein